jgi:hypothetical protein
MRLDIATVIGRPSIFSGIPMKKREIGGRDEKYKRGEGQHSLGASI